MKDENARKDIQAKSFKSALLGIQSGSMKYENDALLPML
jgi:hypothetical protein